MLPIQTQGQVERLLLFAFGNQNHIDHARAVPLEERQPAGKKKSALPALAQLQKVRCLRPRMGRNITHAVHAAKEHGFFIAPGEASTEISMPGITRGRLLRDDLDADIENRSAQPSAIRLS